MVNGQDAEQPAGESKQASAPNTGSDLLNISDLKDMSISELTHIAKEMGIEGATGLRKQELIFKLLAAQTEKSGLIFSEGVLETLPEDRKSTRLNSSHRCISYAVFCLKKKTRHTH